MSAFKRVLSLTLIAILLSSAFPLFSTPAPAAAEDTWTVMESGTTSDLSGVWGNSGNNVFAVGGTEFTCTILHYNGLTWNGMDSGTSEFLRDIWGSSGSDVFAVGGTSKGAIVHYNGINWTVMIEGSIEPLNAVWGSSANDVWAVGNAGTILHYNGIAWTAIASGTSNNLNAVWGTSKNNIYVVGFSGTILHWDGNAWNAMVSNTGAELCGIWGSSPNDIWAVGIANSTTHYDGSSWSSDSFAMMTNYKAVWGTSANHIFIVGAIISAPGLIKYYDGSTWEMMDTFADGLWGIWGSCSNNVFAVGNNGIILHYGSGACPPTSGAVTTSLGKVSFTLDNGSLSRLTQVKVQDTKCSTPTGYNFPYGLFSFNISGINAGQTVRVTVKFPRRLLNGFKYYKCINNQLVDCTSLTTRLDDYTLVLSLTDGGLGDADHSANGTIVDPGGPVEPVTAAQVYGQGTIPAAIQQAPVALSSISVKSASLSSTKVGPGDPVTVTANVANTGTVNGTGSIKVYVNGEMDNSQGVTVSSGSSTPVTFTISRNDPGTYSVYVGGTSAGSFTVDQFTPETILIISGALVFFAFILGIIMVTRRRT